MKDIEGILVAMISFKVAHNINVLLHLLLPINCLKFTKNQLNQLIIYSSNKAH